MPFARFARTWLLPPVLAVLALVTTTSSAAAPGIRTESTPPAAIVVVPAPADAPTVLIIGDSTTYYMLDRFVAALEARGIAATIDAKSGRTVLQGRGVLATYDVSAFDHVVVLLGANGKRSSSLRNMKALKAAGVDTMATVQTPDSKPVNRAVIAVFGAQRITWAGYAKAHGISPFDGKHYRAAGYQARARYLAGAIAKLADRPDPEG